MLKPHLYGVPGTPGETGMLVLTGFSGFAPKTLQYYTHVGTAKTAV